MSSAGDPDKLHYLRIPNALGARAEAVRLVYVLAERPYVDVLSAFADAQATVAGKNPFKQFPFVETASGQVIYQSLAIMHHAANGTSAWPSDPATLTRALMVAMGGYDLYQAFAGFSADDLAAKKKFEEKRAPQLLGGLGEIYAKTKFAAGDTPTFADCIAHEAIAWVVRRNEVCRTFFEASPALVEFRDRFTQIPAIRAFMARQAAARSSDPSV
jgi:glutathione S-transferase